MFKVVITIFLYVAYYPHGWVICHCYVLVAQMFLMGRKRGGGNVRVGRRDAWLACLAVTLDKRDAIRSYFYGMGPRMWVNARQWNLWHISLGCYDRRSCFKSGNLIPITWDRTCAISWTGMDCEVLIRNSVYPVAIWYKICLLVNTFYKSMIT